MKRQRFNQWMAVLGCVAWGLSLTGCAQYYAQRPAGEWTAARAMPGVSPEVDVARIKGAEREDIYTLVRELNDVTPGVEREIGSFYVRAGEPLGFEFGPEGGVFAVAADHREWLEVEPGVTHVWYRENIGWAENPNTGLLILGGIALVAGIVVLAASGNSSGSISF